MKTPVAAASWPDQSVTFLRHINSYRLDNMFCDCTLACDRKFFRAHKMVLSMCSEFFERILSTTSDKNPVIILNDVEAWQIECLLNYMYQGETSVPDSHFSSLCRVAKCLQIKGFDMVELHRKAVKLSKQIESRQLEKVLSPSYAQRNKHMSSQKSYSSQEDLTRSEDSFPRISPGKESPLIMSHAEPQDDRFGYMSDSQNEDCGSEPFYSPKIRREISRRQSELDASLFGKNGKHSPWLKYEDAHPTEEISSIQNSLKPPIVLRESPSPPLSRLPMGSSSSSCRSDTSLRFNSTELSIIPVRKVRQQIERASPACDSPPSVGISEYSALKRKSPVVVSSPSPSSHRKSPGGSTHPREPPPLLKIFQSTTTNWERKRKPCEEADSSSFSKRKATPELETNHKRPQAYWPAPPPRKLSSPSRELALPKEETSDLDTSSSSPTISPPRFSKQTPTPDYPLNLSAKPSPPQEDDDPLLKKIHTNRRKRVRGPKSWEFLLRLLNDPDSNPSLIRWEEEDAGIFRLMQPDVIAQRWGRRTGKQGSDILSYESFARGLRYHYHSKALNAVSEKSYVYQFGPKAQTTMGEVDSTIPEPEPEAKTPETAKTVTIMPVPKAGQPIERTSPACDSPTLSENLL